MIGNAAAGFMPSSATSTRHGAYSPTPVIMSAPSVKLSAAPIHSREPASPSASPPAGSANWRFTRIAHSTSSASPIPMRTCRRGPRATTGAPSNAPATAAAIITTSVFASISMAPM